MCDENHITMIQQLTEHPNKEMMGIQPKNSLSYSFSIFYSFETLFINSSQY